jgi:hypothetical protein
LDKEAKKKKMKLNKSYLSLYILNTLTILAIEIPEISSGEIKKFHRGKLSLVH